MILVQDYLREVKRRKAEVLVPLVHRPGDEAQVDFFEVTVDEAGTRRRAWQFLMQLNYSGRGFAWLYDRWDQLFFLDGPGGPSNTLARCPIGLSTTTSHRR